MVFDFCTKIENGCTCNLKVLLTDDSQNRALYTYKDFPLLYVIS